MPNPTRTMTVDEDLQIIDTTARELSPRSRELLGALSRDGFHSSTQPCMIRHTSGEHGSLSELLAEVHARRTELQSCSEPLGLSVVAAGALPLPAAPGSDVGDTPGWRRFLADYEFLARGQALAALRVRVPVADEDTAVRVSRRVTRHLPVLLALTAASPFRADGDDTGFASSRSTQVYRWPTSGVMVPADSGEEYATLVTELVSSGVISDPGMVRFAVQPGSDGVSVELRGCDSTPDAGTVVLVAGLFRALVEREEEALAAGQASTPVGDPQLRAALWRASRSGLEGDLVDLDTMHPVPAAELIRELVDGVADRAGEEAQLLRDLTERALRHGSSAFRQRRVLRRRGEVADVVDLLVAETSGTLDPSELAAGRSGGVFDTYRPVEGVGGDEAWDEAIGEDGHPRPVYLEALSRMAELGTARLRGRQTAHEREALVAGMTFRVTGQERAQVFPVDVVPRILPADEWQTLARGIEQRERALDAFLRDVYGEQEFVRAGHLSPEALDRTPGYRPTNGRGMAADRVRAHICGVDLVCTDGGRWVVLEDNLRMPSGAAFCDSIRGLTRTVLGDVLSAYDLHDPEEAFPMIRETLLAAAPPAAGDDVRLGVLSTGPDDSGWYEHGLIAERTGAALVTPERLAVVDGRLHHRDDSGEHPLDVVYARIDEEMLLSSTGYDGRVLREPLVEAITAGRLTLANAMGNGVADDKAIYASVPEMIRFFLGEEPMVDQVPTFLCADREQRDHVLEHLDTMVVKPIDGYGGQGITIGPECTEEELEVRREELLGGPERFIAQDIVRLSTLPTFDGTDMQRRHVDLRAFVHVRAAAGGGTTAHAVPTGLTRVAPAGSMIVNSSRGGSGKDTWILRS